MAVQFGKLSSAIGANAVKSLRRVSRIRSTHVNVWTDCDQVTEAKVKHPLGIYASFSTSPCRLTSAGSEGQKVHETPSKRARAIDKDFFLSVLGASATRRDAKDYLNRFKQPRSSDSEQLATTGGTVSDTQGVNLGGLYTSSRAIAQAPSFVQDKTAEPAGEPDLYTHTAIVVLRKPQQLTDDELSGVALTLGQLARLGLPSAVVLDLAEEAAACRDYQAWHKTISAQADRLATAVRQTRKSAAQVLDQALSISTELPSVRPSSIDLRGNVKVNYSTLLSTALQNGIVTVIPPIAYDQKQQAKQVSADDVALALARGLRGLESSKIDSTTDATNNRQPGFSVDRVIILDPMGGLPASERKDNAHIFVNLAQEYPGIRRHLEEALAAGGAETSVTQGSKTDSNVSGKAIGINEQSMSATSSHIRNLQMLQQTLTLLPPTSSGLLIRPQNVATAALTSDQRSGVGTRQRRNPLIHNLLTDRPTVSSSLPSGRVQPGPLPLGGSQVNEITTAPASHATFFKRGMPVTIIPDPAISPWLPPEALESTLTLQDPRVDFPRLLHLIEDSFGRKLDAKHYLHRIQKRLAGIIIAGEYEGGAILTWEYPPSPDGSRRAPVPYLDKFAVLQRSQGAGGVADIVFNAMVRTCFPDGVVWRSRKKNPVNRWYFERAEGTWKIPDTQWTMFWTGNELWSGDSGSSGEQWRKQRWKDYVGVCQNIEASWADNKAPD